MPTPEQVAFGLIALAGPVLAVILNWRSGQTEIALKLIEPLKKRVAEMEQESERQKKEIAELYSEIVVLKQVNAGVRMRLELSQNRTLVYRNGAWRLYHQIKAKLPGEEPVFYPGVEIEEPKGYERKTQPKDGNGPSRDDY